MMVKLNFNIRRQVNFALLALIFVASALALWPIQAAACNAARDRKAVNMTDKALPQMQKRMAGNTARPGHFAELEELEAARKAGTIEAYDLFLARHPDSRYAPEARKERALIIAR
jgi:hypothetical protein